MDATTPLNPEAQRKQDRARKRKAILAGGVVLGLGAAVTLAAWSDDVFADGIFETGTIELEGNVTATGTVANTTAGTWKKYDGPGDETGILAFSPRPKTIVPFEPVYAPIALRLSNSTTIDATDIVLNSVEITGGPKVSPAGPTDPYVLESKLTYTVYTGVTAGECSAANATGIGSATAAVVGDVSDSPGETVNYPTSPSALLKPTGPNTQGILQLCLGIELNSNEDDVKGVDDTTVTWRFTAETD